MVFSSFHFFYATLSCGTLLKSVRSQQYNGTVHKFHKIKLLTIYENLPSTFLCIQTVHVDVRITTILILDRSILKMIVHAFTMYD